MDFTFRELSDTIVVATIFGPVGLCAFRAPAAFCQNGVRYPATQTKQRDLRGRGALQRLACLNAVDTTVEED